MDISKLQWQSDWNGYEVGYPHLSVVGYFTDGNINYYIDSESGHVLEKWEDEQYDNDDC